MKRKFLITFFILTTFFAQANEYSEYCTNQAPSKSFTGVIKSATGINFLTRAIIENELQKALKKEVSANFKVKIKSFWGVNLLEGYFKDIDVKTDNLTYSDITLSDFEVKTVCKYNKVELKNNNIAFAQDLILKYSAKITQKNLNDFVNSTKYKKLTDKINGDKLLSSIFKIQTPTIEIKDNKLLFKTAVEPVAFGSPINISFGANLKLVNGQIELCDIDLNSKKIGQKTIAPIIEKLNPFSQGIKIDQSNEGKLELKNIEIKNSEIILDGILTIFKNI